MFDPAQASFDQVLATARPASIHAAELTSAMMSASRRENQHAAARLTAIGDLYALRFDERDEFCDQWAVDTESAVAVEVAAALNIGHEAAKDQVSLARGLRERLPLVAAVFRAGELSTAIVRVLLQRTGLITDPAILTHVDGKLAGAAARLMALSYGQMCGYVDRIVARQDRDALRRRKRAAENREIWFANGLDGMSSFGGTMTMTDAETVERRLDALADTVCADDPRTKRQRRVDALAAMSSGAERLQCRCTSLNCPKRDAIASPYVIHAFTGPGADGHGGPSADTVGEGGPKSAGEVADFPDLPATLVRNDRVVPPEQATSIAEHGTVRRLVHPGGAAPEPRYRPSRSLGDFVRCRDLACRFPGCDVPAWDCDLDHTIPYGRGGSTQASNIKCLCRLHHLVKTFWGWADRQACDGTVTWTSPAGDTYVTTPGSAVVCPELCAPTAPSVRREVTAEVQGDRGAMMPTRRRTRARIRAARIEAERCANREDREARRRAHDALYRPPPPSPDDEPPPF
jgi:hypothetical protein